jgi:hypothetical protein
MESNKMDDAKSMMSESQPSCLGAVIGSYLILDKSNKVVTEKSTLDEAKSFVAARPYLRYESFELPNTSVACDLDDIL